MPKNYVKRVRSNSRPAVYAKTNEAQSITRYNTEGAENIPVLEDDSVVRHKTKSNGSKGTIDFGSMSKADKGERTKQEIQVEEKFFDYRTKKISQRADRALKVYGSDKPHLSHTVEDGLSMTRDKRVVVSEILKTSSEVEELNYGVLERVLPKGLGTTTCHMLTDLINTTVKGMDPIIGEHFRDNCVGWVETVKGHRYNAKQYLDAVKYVTYRMAGDTQMVAYTKTFPDRLKKMEENGVSMAYLGGYVSAYNATALVANIYAQAKAPTHILYNDYFHKAILTQVEIMTNENVSPKVRSDAANSLIQHLKTPETKKAELTIALEDNDMISQLKETMMGLAQAQLTNVQNGSNTVIDIAEAEIIKGE